MSNFWKLFKKVGAQLHMSTTYHPQTYEQTKVTNRWFICIACQELHQSNGLLTYLGLNFDSTPITIYPQRCLLFCALYGQDPPPLLKGTTIPSQIEEVNQLTHQKDAFLKEFRENLLKAHDQMRKYADCHREKLSPRFYGPYKILAKVGAVAFKLDLPPHSRIHPVFQVSQLKKALHPTQLAQLLPEVLTEDHELQVTPESVLDCKVQCREAAGNFDQVLGESYRYASAFPQFHLEDKVHLDGAGIDTVRPEL
ncbi:hypothetical protein CR513_60908, partial [Mucuna pruriens]